MIRRTSAGFFPRSILWLNSSFFDSYNIPLVQYNTKITDLPIRPYIRMLSSDHGYHRRDERKRRLRPSRVHLVDKHYSILGVPRNASPETVKRKFLQLALRYHPDTSSDADRSHDKFVKIREAFEGIKEYFAAECGGGPEMSSWFTEEEFDEWFYEETGQRTDSSMRREVMNVYRSGLTRTEYGAVWEIAFILEEEGFFAKQETSKHASGSHGDRTNPESEKDKAAHTSRRKRNYKK